MDTPNTHSAHMTHPQPLGKIDADKLDPAAVPDTITNPPLGTRSSTSTLGTASSGISRKAVSASNLLISKEQELTAVVTPKAQESSAIIISEEFGNVQSNEIPTQGNVLETPASTSTAILSSSALHFVTGPPSKSNWKSDSLAPECSLCGHILYQNLIKLAAIEEAPLQAVW
jgi:hypothetical protein